MFLKFRIMNNIEFKNMIQIMTVAEKILIEAQQALHEKRFSHAIATSLSLLGDENLMIGGLNVLKKVPIYLLRLPSSKTIAQLVPYKEFSQNLKKRKEIIQQKPCDWILALEILHTLSPISPDHTLLTDSINSPPEKFKKSIEFEILESIFSSATKYEVNQKLLAILNKTSEEKNNAETTYKIKLIYLASLSKLNKTDQNDIQKILTNTLKENTYCQTEYLIKLVFLLLKVTEKLDKETSNIINKLFNSQHDDNVVKLVKSYTDWNKGYSKQLLSSLDKLEKDIVLMNDFYQHYYWQLRCTIFHRLKMPAEENNLIAKNIKGWSGGLFESLVQRLPDN